MLVPEIILYNTINTFLEIVKDDYTSKVDKTQTILFSIFDSDDNNNKLLFETYDWYKQAKSLFLKNSENVRQLSVNIGYNLERISIPTIHIMLPSESKGAFDSIGRDEQSVYDEEAQILNTSKSQTFRSNYNLLITSDNSSEVLLVYYFLRSFMLLYDAHYGLMGMLNMQFSGQDVNIDQELVPTHIFHRNLTLQFDYESIVNIKMPQEAITRLRSAFCQDIALDNPTR